MAPKKKPTSSESEGSKTYSTRGPCLMKEFMGRRTRDGRVPIQFDDRLEPVGMLADNWKSFLGSLARAKVDICLSSWAEVDEKLKDSIWDNVQVMIAL